MIVLIVTLSRIQGEQNREQFSVYLGKATCQLYTSSGVITMMMTTMGKHTTLNANIELLFFSFWKKKKKNKKALSVNNDDYYSYKKKSQL